MKTLKALIFFHLMTAACTSVTEPGEVPRPPFEKAYLKKVEQTSPRQFLIKNELAEGAWERGSIFIQKFSDMEIVTAETNRVSTKDPQTLKARPQGEFRVPIGYKVERKVRGDQTQFSVQCLRPKSNKTYTPALCQFNEKMLAHYMKTGELMEKFVNTKNR